MPVIAELIASAALAQVGGVAVQPPVAKKVPHETTIHGRTFTDDYFWLREKSNPDVIKHLEAENAYTDEVMAATKGFRRRFRRQVDLKAGEARLDPGTTKNVEGRSST